MGVAAQTSFMGMPSGSLDKKGRACIPAHYRQILTAQGTTGLYVRPHPGKPALQCYGETLFEEYQRSKPIRNPFSEEHDDEAFDVYAQTEPHSFDENGRVRLLQSLIDHAHLGENVTFVGLGEKFEIWDTQQLDAWRAERRTKASRPAASP
jgi:MraZ protein